MRTVQAGSERGPALGTNMIAVVVGRVFALAVGFAAIALLTRHLGPEGYGQYRTILTLTGVGAILAELGLQLVVLREISDPTADGRRSLGAGLTLRLIATSAVMLAVAAIAQFLPYDEAVLLGVVVAAPYYVLYQSCLLLQGVFQKHLRQDLQMVAETAGGLVMLLCVYLAIRAEAGVVAMVAGLVAGGAVQLLLAWLMAARREPFRLAIDLAAWRRLLDAGLPIAGSRIALMAILRGDILILSLLGTAAAVGLYGVPSKMFEILAGLAGLFAGMLMPMLVEALARQDSARTGEVISGALDTMLIFGGGVVACFVAFGSDVLALLAGPAFTPAYPALCLIGVAVMTNATGQIFRHVLLAMHLQALAMRVDLVGLACVVVAYVTMLLASTAGLHWFLAMAMGGVAYLALLAFLRAIPLDLLLSRRGRVTRTSEGQPAE